MIPGTPTEEITYTLREAKERLGIDFRTLRRRMEQEGITPVEDKKDRRNLLLTAEEVERLGKSTRKTKAPPKPSALLSQLSRTINGIVATLKSLEATVSDIQKNVRSLTKKVDQKVDMKDYEEFRRQVLEKLKEENKDPHSTNPLPAI